MQPGKTSWQKQFDGAAVGGATMIGPELPVIYENPRFDAATPTLQPVFNRAIRFGAVMMLEWGRLTVIEDSPRYLKVGTIVVACLVLAVHESWPWLRMRNWRWYPALMAILLVSYAGIFAYAVVDGEHKAKPAAQIILPQQLSPPSVTPVDKRKNPLDSEEAKWSAVSRLHDGFERSHAQKCKVSIVRYQLPYAEDFSDSIKEIFKVLDWPISESFATGQLPRGLSVKFAQGLPISQLCQNIMVNSFNAISWKTGVWAGNAVFPGSPSEVCRDCIEIDIGNDPEQH
jgi:hypothetical protein